MRVLVCGGREFGAVPKGCPADPHHEARLRANRERRLVFDTLDMLHVVPHWPRRSEMSEDDFLLDLDPSRLFAYAVRRDEELAYLARQGFMCVACSSPQLQIRDWSRERSWALWKCRMCKTEFKVGAKFPTP
jgi:hypothetical protein